MSKNKKSNYSNQIYFRVEAHQVTLIPGQVIYVPEPKEETDKKMKSEKWSTQIAKSRHYMFICSDGRFATVLPLSSEPPKNPFQIQFTDKLRSGLDLTVRCDQKCKLPLTRLVEGKYSNFKGIAYTFDKYTTMKLIGYSIAYELHQWYNVEDAKSMIDYAWNDLPTMINSFKGSFSNMEYDFRHGPQADYDSDTDYISAEEIIDDEDTAEENEESVIESETITELKKKIEDLTNKLETVCNREISEPEVPDVVETPVVESEAPIVEETAPVEEIKEDDSIVPESATENASIVESTSIDAATEIITGGDLKEISKISGIDDETAEAIEKRQSYINTYSLMENIKGIRSAKGLKVDPKVVTPPPVVVVTKENAERIREEINAAIKAADPMEEKSHLNAEFTILDNMKFPKTAPLSAKGDSIKAFINNECAKVKTEYTSLRVLYTAYKKYCQSTGLWCASLGDLKCYLILHGYKVERLMIDQKDKPLDAVNIVLKEQLKLIEQIKKSIDLNPTNEPVSVEVNIAEEVKEKIPEITFKGNRVVWTSELLEYAEELVAEQPEKATEMFHYKSVKSLKATLASYKKRYAEVK